MRMALWRLWWRLRSRWAGGLSVGDLFPDFSLCDLEGRRHSLLGGKEQRTVLWFTNLCDDCRARVPILEDLRRREGGRARILAVSLLGAEEELPRRVAAGCAFPILLDPEDIVASRLGLPHPSGACPLHNLFILDARGYVVFRHHLSALTAESFLRVWQGLAPAVDAQGPAAGA